MVHQNFLERHMECTFFNGFLTVMSLFILLTLHSLSIPNITYLVYYYAMLFRILNLSLFSPLLAILQVHLFFVDIFTPQCKFTAHSKENQFKKIKKILSRHSLYTGHLIFFRLRLSKQKAF